MRNERNLYFETLTVEQTDLLLGSLDHLPVSSSVARRIRGRVLQSAAPKAQHRNRIRKTLIPIAACLLVIVLFFVANPKAAHAVSAFFDRVFTPSRYMNADPAERTPVPSIDEAIAAAAPKDGDYRVEFVTELPNAKEILGSRAEIGLPPYNQEDWLWMADIRPEMAEVLYDGNQLIWNTNLYMDNVHVRECMEDFGIESGSKFAVDALVEGVSFTVEGDPTVYQLNSSGGGIQPIFTEEELAQADHVILNTDFSLDKEHPLPSGVLTITQEIVLFELSRGVGQSVVAALYHTFTFDTTKGNIASAEAKEGDFPLSGDQYFSMNHLDINESGDLNSWTIDTRKISLDGVVFHADYEYLPTGINVRISFADPPEGWTDAERQDFMLITSRDYNGTYRHPGISADYYIDDKLVSEAPIPDGVEGYTLAYILPIYPEQYGTIGEISLKLNLVYYVTLDGKNLVNGEVYEEQFTGAEVPATLNFAPLVEIPVPLP